MGARAAGSAAGREASEETLGGGTDSPERLAGQSWTGRSLLQAWRACPLRGRSSENLLLPLVSLPYRRRTSRRGLGWERRVSRLPSQPAQGRSARCHRGSSQGQQGVLPLLPGPDTSLVVWRPLLVMASCTCKTLLEMSQAVAAVGEIAGPIRLNFLGLDRYCLGRDNLVSSIGGR